MVDPATGAVRTTVVSPTGRRPDSEGGRSALSPDGATLYLVVSVVAGDDVREQLFAIDTRRAGARPARPGRRRRGRLVVPDRPPAGRARRAAVRRGDASCSTPRPTEVAERRIPTLLTYDAGLAPVGGPVRATGLAEGAETKSVAGAADGTVFLLVDGARTVPGCSASRTAAGPGPLLAQLTDRIYGYALVVEPAQVWAVIPGPTGAEAIDLTTGEERGSADRRVRAAARRPQPVPRPGRRADDRRVRHPARGHPDAVVPRAR